MNVLITNVITGSLESFTELVNASGFSDKVMDIVNCDNQLVVVYRFSEDEIRDILLHPKDKSFHLRIPDYIKEMYCDENQ